MRQRAVQELQEQTVAESSKPTQSRKAMLWDMVSFSDLEELLVRGCRDPENQPAVSQYVRWMSGHAGRWKAEETLLELLAVLAIAAQLPRSEEDAMT